MDLKDKILYLIIIIFIYNGAKADIGTNFAPQKYSNEDIAKICLKSVYEQSNLKNILKKEVKIIKNELPKELLYTIKFTYPITKILIEKRISYKWEF